jgi:hypothetical protein
MKRIRSKLTYANVISTLCLFLVLGGGAYAATQLPRNSVGAKQLKNGSITLAKLSTAAKNSLKGAAGPVGPAGPQGSKGDAGAAGATNVVVRVGNTELNESTATCHSGEVATGGGGFTPNPEEVLWGSFPQQENEGEKPTAWIAGAETLSGSAGEVTAYVICASP